MAGIPFIEDDYMALYDIFNHRFKDHFTDNLREYLASDENEFTHDTMSAETKQYMMWMSFLPIVSDLGTIADSYRSFQDYMKNYSLTWDDIVYPFLTAKRFGFSNAGGHIASGLLNFTSSNVERLYK